jgi:hypothetical protein
MTMGVFDFKAIRRKLDCQEQKAEFEEKNPLPDPNKVVWTPEWGYGAATPYRWARVNDDPLEYAIAQGRFGDEFVKRDDGSCLSRPLSSLAHPEWPYTGSPHEWRKFKI